MAPDSYTLRRFVGSSLVHFQTKKFFIKACIENDNIPEDTYIKQKLYALPDRNLRPLNLMRLSIKLCKYTVQTVTGLVTGITG